MITLIATIIYYLLLFAAVLITGVLAIGSLIHAVFLFKGDVDGSSVMTWLLFAGAIILWVR